MTKASQSSPSDILSKLLSTRGEGELPLLCLAPMTGISDKPMRLLARRFGADVVTGEMISGRSDIRDMAKTLYRRDREGEAGPIITQILGSEPDELARSAKFYVDEGSDVIDINMGCPARKVLKKWAGSALLAHPDLVRSILEAVVEASEVPVTLKTRLGVRPGEENILEIARIARDAGVRAITVHGRTREERFLGEARYDLIARLKREIDIPVTANGDIDSPFKALEVWRATGADALMVGRAAEGRPWIFQQIGQMLESGKADPFPFQSGMEVMLEHLGMIHEFYGGAKGAAVARGRVKSYLEPFGLPRERLAGLCSIREPGEQILEVGRFLRERASSMEFWPEPQPGRLRKPAQGDGSV